MVHLRQLKLAGSVHNDCSRNCCNYRLQAQHWSVDATTWSRSIHYVALRCENPSENPLQLYRPILSSGCVLCCHHNSVTASTTALTSPSLFVFVRVARNHILVQHFRKIFDLITAFQYSGTVLYMMFFSGSVEFGTLIFGPTITLPVSGALRRTINKLELNVTVRSY